MFNFMKKKIDKNVYSPVDGEFIRIEEVSDKTFSSKVMGEGFAVRPQSGVISAPCDGTITMIFPTNHAFAITSNDGKEILVHIGIDTVNLNGKGFTALKKVNEKVKAGDDIIKLDRESIPSKYDMSTMVIITNNITGEIQKGASNQPIKKKELVMTFE